MKASVAWQRHRSRRDAQPARNQMVAARGLIDVRVSATVAPDKSLCNVFRKIAEGGLVWKLQCDDER